MGKQIIVNDNITFWNESLFCSKSPILSYSKLFQVSAWREKKFNFTFKKIWKESMWRMPLGLYLDFKLVLLLKTKLFSKLEVKIKNR